MRYELADHEWTRYQADAAEQAAWRSSGERQTGPEWHLLGPSIGAPWRDLPTAFGPYTTCYNRFVRWRRAIDNLRAAVGHGIIEGMPALTRRRDKDRHQDVAQWGWHCGFSPASDRGLRASGTAATREQARADFAEAWASYLPRCTEGDFEGYRRQEAWTRWKYEMHETGCKLPTQLPELRSRCFCGMTIDSVTMDQHVFTNHMAA